MRARAPPAPRLEEGPPLPGPLQPWSSTLRGCAPALVPPVPLSGVPVSKRPRRRRPPLPACVRAGRLRPPELSPPHPASPRPQNAQAARRVLLPGGRGPPVLWTGPPHEAVPDEAGAPPRPHLRPVPQDGVLRESGRRGPTGRGLGGDAAPARGLPGPTFLRRPRPHRATPKQPFHRWSEAHSSIAVGQAPSSPPTGAGAAAAARRTLALSRRPIGRTHPLAPPLPPLCSGRTGRRRRSSPRSTATTMSTSSAA